MCSTWLTLRAKDRPDSSTPVSTPLARSCVNTVTSTVGAPSKVPAVVIQKLNADLNATLSAPEMQQRWKDLGITKVGNTPEFAAQYFARETEKWNRVIQAAGIKAD